MSRVQEDIKQAELHCKERGIRLTDKRKQVLSSLLKADRAMSAYELADYCKSESGESGKAMPAMSVYRILDFLEKAQLVHRLDSNNKYIGCSHISCSHGHGVTQFLICQQCQRVEEIHIEQSMIEQLQSNVENAGYHLISPQVEMKCICESCFADTPVS